MNLLLISMCCNASKGSEWAVGWDFLIALSKKYSITTIVSAEDREYIEKNYCHLDCDVDFIYIPVGWDSPRSRNIIISQLQFNRLLRHWHNKAFEKATEIISQKQIDIVHKLTPCGFRAPGKYWALGCPSVWGPVTGYSQMPLHLLGGHVPYFERLNLKMKKYVSGWDLKYKTQVRRAISGYSAIISGSSYLCDRISDMAGRKATLIVQSGLGEGIEVVPEAKVRNEDEPLQLVWTGSMLPRKNLAIVLEGLALIGDNVNWKLHIIGDGQMENEYKKLTERLNLSDKVIFHGRLPREMVLEYMRRCHVFVILSSYDSAPGVVYEAYSCGLPVISLDYSGFADCVNDACGMRIEPVSKKYVCKQLAAIISSLYMEEEKRQQLANNAIAEARLSFYDKKIDTLDDIYSSILKQ